ncbi:receptor-type tyrosine-protein phosphatase epsilon-like, partial [Saccostrea cucullata]|uniref:receptor-type tyrosine-protein phosphatase epsilon-like n=1 Tax=Saccostrea cuccullata TaxID=36930 RepID=UPI002ED693EE
DLSYGKRSEQSSSYPCLPVSNCVASNAVDRDNKTCMKSESIGSSSTYKTVWWYVDLGDVYSVYSIRILFKNYGEEHENRQKGRFAGFSLYLSTTANTEDGHLCYKDGPQLPPLDFTTICNGHGSYIIFYNERYDKTVYPAGYKKLIVTELCEVVVKGCNRGTYGILCNKNCSKHCEDNKCDIINGTCLGCMPGWTGQFCQTPCDSGSYGKNCKLRCSGHCFDDQACNHVTGICDEGCAPGWTRQNCNESCIYGRYGPSCASNCSGHCLNGNTCNKETGHCDSGCTPGYIGNFCKKVCPGGRFGEGCKQRCSGHCTNDEHCYHVDGHCPNGCQNGYLGNICNNYCAAGFYGANCSKLCSQNCKGKCNHTDGSCFCKIGWKGSPMCNTECAHKTYGENCIHSCSPNCVNVTCDRFNGSCTEGCKEPFYGDVCNQQDGTLRFQSKRTSAQPLTIGAVLGAFTVVIILLALLALFMRIRRKIDKEASNTSVSIRMSKITLQNQEAASAANATKKSKERDNHQLHKVEEKAKRGPPTNKTILKRNLQAIIVKMSAAENAGFKHEYHEIPRGELFPCEEAKKPENKAKNRYTTTFPYDHSRVVLKTISPNESDYINANYIEDTQSNLKYIATQGPKPKTVVDFWRMVWQECVNTIVCLTNLKEGTKIKCTLYWPNINDKMKHGNFMIRNLEEKIYANHTSRRFKVYNNLERKDREVLMFHYTRWPDHGVPDPLNLLVFHRHVMKTSPQTGKYTLVHCSAGIGRTGTYIALDALYREGEINGRVNVPMYVRNMRKDRMNMIQGEDQYRVLYLALCESFSGRSKCWTAEKIFQGGSCYSNCGEVTNTDALTSEFQSLQSLRVKYAEKDYEPGQTNISANYTESVLPVEKFMCYLSYVKGRNNYYNAVLLQSFTENDSLISAQYPLPDYTEDFIRLIRDFDARVVVFLGPFKEIKSSSLWVPSKSENKTVGSFVLNLSTSTNSVNFTTRNIVLQPKGSSDIKMTVLECKTWKEGRFLTDKRVLLDVVKEAKAEKDKQEGKILVLSSDGATRCGSFCIVYNALEQLSMDQEVDIFTITQQLQIRRPEFVSTMEEYQLCYDVVSEYMQNDSVYANC